MNYLLYIEHAAENLQFFLWYQDYVKRFNDAFTSDTLLSPEWTQAMEDETAARIQKDTVERLKKEPKTITAIFKGTDFEKGAAEIAVTEIMDPFPTPPATPSDDDATSLLSGSQAPNYQIQAQDAFDAAGVTQPCSSPPPFTPTHLHNPINIISDPLLTPHSHHPTLPRRNQPRDRDVHQALRPAAAQPVLAGAEDRDPSTSVHDAPVDAAGRRAQRRGHAAAAGAPELRALGRVQRQPGARGLRAGAGRGAGGGEHAGRARGDAERGGARLAGAVRGGLGAGAGDAGGRVEGHVRGAARAAPSACAAVGAVRRFLAGLAFFFFFFQQVRTREPEQ